MIVCSAGNDHSDNDANPHFPASYPNPNVISVAAVNINEQLAGFSNFGAKSVDLAAPGQDVTSTYPTTLGEYKSLNGTSMASPHVAGAAALVWGQPKYAQKTSKEVKSLLLDNARKLNVLG